MPKAYCEDVNLSREPCIYDTRPIGFGRARAGGGGMICANFLQCQCDDAFQVIIWKFCFHKYSAADSPDEPKIQTYPDWPEWMSWAPASSSMTRCTACWSCWWWCWRRRAPPGWTASTYPCTSTRQRWWLEAEREMGGQFRSKYDMLSQQGYANMTCWLERLTVQPQAYT